MSTSLVVYYGTTNHPRLFELCESFTFLVRVRDAYQVALIITYPAASRTRSVQGVAATTTSATKEVDDPDD